MFDCAWPAPTPAHKHRHMNTTAALHELRRIVGNAQVLDSGDLTPYEIDGRKRYRGRALAVVSPASTDEVAAIVRCCATHGLSLVPQGGNTSTVGGAVPDDSGHQVLLSLRRLDRIRHIDPANLTLTAEAGCVLQRVQDTAAQAGLLFPLSLASEGSCTIGGNLASNAGGTQVLRYGNARELCLGLEVVTATGAVWQQLSGLRKDNTGYDLRDLFIGSEGTLGIITAATLRLFPQPATTVTALIDCANLNAALSVLQHARATFDAELTGFEIMNRASIELVRGHRPDIARAHPAGTATSATAPTAAWTALIEIASGYPSAIVLNRVEDTLQQLLCGGHLLNATLAHNQQQARAMWQLREAIPLAQASEGLNIKHDIAVPVSALPVFVDQVSARIMAQWPGARLITFGHMGDGNLHYNVQAPIGQEAAVFLHNHEAAINTLVFDAVVAHGGSIAAEHGIGQLRRNELARRKDALSLDLMRTLKRTLDPDNRLNPGKLL